MTLNTPTPGGLDVMLELASNDVVISLFRHIVLSLKTNSASLLQYTSYSIESIETQLNSSIISMLTINVSQFSYKT